MNKLISIIVIYSMLVKTSSASLLLIDEKNPCRARGNATVFDITNLVEKWPVPLKGSGVGGEYIYWWSCSGNTKVCDDSDTTVCQQRADESILTFNAGNLSPQLWFGQFNGASVQVSSTRQDLEQYFDEILVFRNV